MKSTRYEERVVGGVAGRAWLRPKSMCCSDCHLIEPQKLIDFYNLWRLGFKTLLAKKKKKSSENFLLPNFQSFSASSAFQTIWNRINKII